MYNVMFIRCVYLDFDMDGGGVPRGLSEMGSSDEDEERVSWGLSSPPMSDDDADVDDADDHSPRHGLDSLSE